MPSCSGSCAASPTTSSASIARRGSPPTEDHQHGDRDPEEDRELYRTLRLQIIEREREALLTARDDGTYSASVLTGVLETLDADQISMELREEHRDEA